MNEEHPTTTDAPPAAEETIATAVDESGMPAAEASHVEDAVEPDAATRAAPPAAVAAEVDTHATAVPEQPAEEAPPPSNKKWYVVKVTSGREESIKAAIERKVKIEGLEEFYGQIVIPVERVTEVKKVKETKNGEKVTREKRVIKEHKKFPGYVMAEVEWNDRILYLFRETNGVGDFVGASGPHKPPVPMTELEVRRMLGEPGAGGKEGKDGGKTPTVVKLDFEKGDKVRIREGMFANTEGEVKEISTPKEAGETPQVTVVVMVFGRPVDVTLDYWQVDKT